ncbi:MAG: hypothetical protein ACRD2W_03415, partial [Acidimicrobiales bacterium]
RNPRLTTHIDDLTTALCAHASGVYCAEAAVGLLIGHGRWLGRSNFVDQFVTMVDETDATSPMAAVDWPAAVAGLEEGRLPCSSSEGQVLRLAASIADGPPVDLGAALCGLDTANLALVGEAVLHAGGHPPVTPMGWEA